MSPRDEIETNDVDDNDDIESSAPANCSPEQSQQTVENINEDQYCEDKTSGVIHSSPESGLLDTENPIGWPCGEAKVFRYNIAWKCAAIFLHAFDVGSDWGLIVQYLADREWTNFALTALLVLVSSFISMTNSMMMYNQDVEANRRSRKGPEHPTGNKLLWCRYYWPIVITFQFAPSFRLWDCFNHALETYKARKEGKRVKQEEHYLKMLFENLDLSVLLFVESFLESAPQLILQLTILQKQYLRPGSFTFVSQVYKILVSLVSLGCCIPNFNSNVKLVQPEKGIITKCGYVFQFFWYFSIIVSRIISVSIIASAWPSFACVWFFIHWLFMTIWISEMEPSSKPIVHRYRRLPYCPPTAYERMKSPLFTLVLGVVFFFTPVNIEGRTTAGKHTFYYTLCFVENIVACCCWAYLSAEEITTRWYFEFLIVLCIVPFILGIVCMLVYYEFESVMREPIGKGTGPEYVDDNVAESPTHNSDTELRSIVTSETETQSETPLSTDTQAIPFPG